MTHPPAERPARRAARPYASGRVFLVAAVALLVAGGAFALVNAACACTTPPDLVVVNRSDAAARVDWHTDGLLGTPLFRAEGTIRADGCRVTSWPLAPGHVTALVQATTSTGTIDVSVRTGADRRPTFVLIAADGSVGPALPDWPAGTNDSTTCP